MAQTDMKPVTSTNVAAIGYDAAARELTVQWQSGKTSVYESVPPNVASDVQNAPSVGRAVHSLLKGTYQHRYVS